MKSVGWGLQRSLHLSPAQLDFNHIDLTNISSGSDTWQDKSLLGFYVKSFRAQEPWAEVALHEADSTTQEIVTAARHAAGRAGGRVGGAMTG
eukprot:8022797-Pyramimonas_sp.AAC.1